MKNTKRNGLNTQKTGEVLEALSGNDILFSNLNRSLYWVVIVMGVDRWGTRGMLLKT